MARKHKLTRRQQRDQRDRPVTARDARQHYRADGSPKKTVRITKARHIQWQKAEAGKPIPDFYKCDFCGHGHLGHYSGYGPRRGEFYDVGHTNTGESKPMIATAKKTVTQKIYEALASGDSVKSKALTRISPKAPARISDLRRRGYNIVYDAPTESYQLRAGEPKLTTFVRLEIDREVLVKEARACARTMQGGLRGKAGRDFVATVTSLSDAKLRDVTRRALDPALVTEYVVAELESEATITG